MRLVVPHHTLEARVNDELKGTMLLPRRQAMQVLGVGLASGLLLSGCKEEAKAPTPAPAPPAPVAAPPAPAAVEAKPADTRPAEAAAEPGGLDCKDKAPIDDTSTAMRKALQYKDKSDVPGRSCQACAQFEGKKFGDCGGCKLFTGAVNPGGNCLSFTPIAAK
jgi:hypothetical protein